MTLDEIVSTYCAAWNEKDEVARTAMLEKAWGDSGVYEDPTGVVPPGRASLHAHIGAFHQAYADARIVRTSGADQHHGKIYFTWQMVMPDGTVAIDGRDFGELDASGRIAHIIGFFGPPPAL
ncbi:nuclear transport factor 2 family protein [Paraburkholderia fungorum]|uniref:nuclear transport factor 2 family protein n=1 Tax=Paraburkholderia fungorum TaxID=134537 RepID=UPI0038B9A6C9